MKKMTLTKTQSAIAITLLASGFAAYAGSDVASKAPNGSHTDVSPVGSTMMNQVGVASTRHNLTQSFLGATSSRMDDYRNDYGEVCVYCHTPHGANTEKAVAQAPLWNRTYKATSYTPYNSMTLMDNPNASNRDWSPGVNSLTCLSCHDGTVAIDSIINMPGSGGYDSRQMTEVRTSFLDNWKNPLSPGLLSGHVTLGSSDPAADSCMTTCHSPGKNRNATDFTAFVIGTDLRNDHPVGVRYPSGPVDEVGFFQPGSVIRNLKYFDEKSDGLSKEDIRVFSYDGNTKYQVECSSCHDPHGVPSAGPGSKFIPSFLRKPNSGSNVCLTCHAK